MNRSERTRVLSDRPGGKGAVVYWMHREMRLLDNFGLLEALDRARAANAPLAAVFCLASGYPEACLRHYAFLLAGLEETRQELAALGIPLFVLPGDPPATLASFCADHDARAVVTDFDPLRVKRAWLDQAAGALAAPLVETDSRNIVPCLAASDKKEFAARTIRPKIHRQLARFLAEPDEPGPPPVPWSGPWPQTDIPALLRELDIDRSVAEVNWLIPGPAAAQKVLQTFLAQRLNRYGKKNDPGQRAESDLSPYLHFGQISSLRVALAVGAADADPDAKDDFLEQLIVRRELAENFCAFEPSYDCFAGFPDWAKTTLGEHREDEREYLYSPEQFEAGATHDELWNAAQSELAGRGKMHGYLRMYWAKKILEWSPSPEEAMRTAVRLNDRLALDGRDPNGYAGAAWAVGGVHDRAFKERPVSGKVRYMSRKGCERKFDTAAYIRRATGED